MSFSSKKHPGADPELTNPGQWPGEVMAGPFESLPSDTAVSYEQLDTPTATQYSRSQQDNRTTGSVVYSSGEHDVTRVGAKVSINGTSIQPLTIQIIQEMGGHNQLIMRFRHEEVQPLGSMLLDGAEKLLGQVAEVELYDVNGFSSDALQNLFVIAEVDFDQHSSNEGEVLVHGYAPTWLLDGQQHFETFYQKNLNTVAKSLTEASLSQVKAGLKADATLQGEIPFLCRYNESAWNFLKRISTETGQWLYFNGKELIFGKPEAQSGTKIVYGGNCSQIQMKLRSMPMMQQMFDYDASGNSPIVKPADQNDGGSGGYNAIAHKKSKELFGTILSVAHPNFLPANDAYLESISKARSARQVSDMYHVSGESDVYMLRVGLNADVDLKRRNKKESHIGIRVTKVAHNWHITGKYTNNFEGITVQAETPPPIPYTQPLTAPMLAQVIDNNDGQGRVRVQFMGWQQKEGIPETDYIRVLTPDGGGTEAVMQNRGYVFIPEVGDQVMVAFENNSPERPYVQGSIFHGSSGLGGKSENHLKTIQTRSGHIISFDDANSGTHIIIKDPGGNEIYLDTRGKNITITAPETMTLNCKNMNINVAENMTTSVGQNNAQMVGMNNSVSVGENNMTTIGAMNDTIVGGNNMVMVTGDFSEFIEGNLVSEAKKDRTEYSEQGIDISSKGSIVNNAESEIKLNSNGNSKSN